MNKAAETSLVKIYEINDILIDLHLREIAKGTEICRPEEGVFLTLVYFLENRGRTLTVEEFQNKLWADADVSEFEILRNIMKVRHALDDDENKTIISFDAEKQGYKFDGEVLELEIQ